MDKRTKDAHIEASLEGTFYFPPDDAIYKEHFPGYPVVPGSMIVNAFLMAAPKLGFVINNIKIENFRFKEFLVPGTYAFRIKVNNGQLHCFIVQGDKDLVTGILKNE